MELTTYGANALLDGTALPATLYAQLHTAEPGDLGGDDISALCADRESFTRTTAAAKVADNVLEILWTADAGTSEIAIAVSIHDAATVGNCWMVGDLLEAVAVDGGQEYRFDVGALIMAVS